LKKYTYITTSSLIRSTKNDTRSLFLRVQSVDKSSEAWTHATPKRLFPHGRKQADRAGAPAPAPHGRPDRATRTMARARLRRRAGGLHLTMGIGVGADAAAPSGCRHQGSGRTERHAPATAWRVGACPWTGQKKWARHREDPAAR